MNIKPSGSWNVLVVFGHFGPVIGKMRLRGCIKVCDIRMVEVGGEMAVE